MHEAEQYLRNHDAPNSLYVQYDGSRRRLFYNPSCGFIDFKKMEQLTDNRQVDFDPADGFQAFVDACRWWFDGKTNDEKIFIWHEFVCDKPNKND